MYFQEKHFPYHNIKCFSSPFFTFYLPISTNSPFTSMNSHLPPEHSHYTNDLPFALPTCENDNTTSSHVDATHPTTLNALPDTSSHTPLTYPMPHQTDLHSLMARTPPFQILILILQVVLMTHIQLLLHVMFYPPL